MIAWVLDLIKNDLIATFADFRNSLPYQTTIIVMLFGCAMMWTGDVKTFGKWILWALIICVSILTLMR